MKDEIRQPTPPNPDSEAESRASPDTEQLAAQMSALLADLVRTPSPDLEELSRVLRPGDRLGRFTLVRQLGRGGMGVVWEAEDPDLSRRVAVKVVRPGASAKVHTREWLQREAEAVARLSHPNIVTLFDFGVADSGPFLVFELLQGEPLDRRLRHGPLPVDSVLRIGVEACRALVHAHRAGVVHRDLKPGNVHVSDAGDVKILDFGLASLLGRTGPAEGGTPAFMAPEQWRGELGDERSDLFALGVTLWAALTGAAPYPVKDGRSAVEQPGPAPRLPAAAPARLRRLIERCVERDPSRRPASAKAVLDELRALEASLAGRWRRRLLALVSAAAVAAAGAAGWLWWSKEPPPGERLSVIVADAENQAGDANLDRVGDLLAASLAQSRRLALLPRERLEVVARDSKLGRLERLDPATARELGRLAGADLVLLPAVRRDGAGLLVELKAVAPQDDRGRFFLSESAGGPAEVPAVLDRLGDAARRKLRERTEDLKAGRIEVARAFSPNLEAARAYFDGLACLRRTNDLGVPLDVSCPAFFERALALDPAFALAHYQLAWFEIPWGAPVARGRPHAEAALRAVDRLPAREAALVRALAAHVEGRDDEALRQYDGLLSRLPDDAEVLHLAATLEWTRGRFAESVPYRQRLLALDPSDDEVRLDLAQAFGLLGRTGELRRLVTEAKALPQNPFRLRAIVEGLVRLGEGEEAVALARLAVQGPPSPQARGSLTRALELTGRFEELEAYRRTILDETANRWYSLADAVAVQGRFREAEGLLEEGARRDERGLDLASQIRATWLGDGRDPARFWREAARLLARDPDAGGNMAVIAALRGDLPHAEALLAPLGADLPERRQTEALLAWRRGDATDALARLAALDSRDPEPVMGLHPSYLVGEVAVAAGEPRVALNALERFQGQPVKGYWSAWGWPRAHYLRARAHLALGDRDAARAELDRLLTLYRRADPELPLLREARTLRARL